MDDGFRFPAIDYRLSASGFRLTAIGLWGFGTRGSGMED